MVTSNGIDAVEIWVDAWGELLDRLLASGVSTISADVAQSIHRWIDSAELLGFHEQALATKKLIDDESTKEQKSQCFFQLVTQQDLTRRLIEARALQEDYNNIDDII